jgi:hypothetical protein
MTSIFQSVRMLGVFFACSFFALTAVRAEDDTDAFDKERAVIKSLEEEIRAELKTLDRSKLKDEDWAKEWAGKYYCGDGLGMKVTIGIAPKSGLVYTWYGCLGLYDANHGKIVETFPGGIKVKLAIDPEKTHYKFISSKLYFVRWGDQRYLVPESQMRGVIIDYNRGGSMREQLWGTPMLFRGNVEHDLGRPDPGPPGQPELPPEYARLIFQKPIQLSVANIKILDREDSETYSTVNGELELNGGADVGIFAGTEIDCDGQDRYGSITITKVDNAKCLGTFNVTLYEKTAEMLGVGSIVSLPGAKPGSHR